MAHRMQWRDYRGSGAELYERYMVPAIFEPWAADFVTLVAPRAGERTLDLACGTGAVARRVAPLVGAGGRVVGLDISAAMLAYARALPPPSGAAIEWWEGDAGALPFADGAFDVALCQQGLQFFPDQHAALWELRRVLADDGRAALSVFRTSRGHFALADALIPHLGPEAAASVREPFALDGAEELSALLAGAGFREVTLRPVIRTARFAAADDFIGYMLATRLANAMAGLDEAARAALVADADAALAPYVGADGLTFPMEANVAVALA